MVNEIQVILQSILWWIVFKFLRMKQHAFTKYIDSLCFVLTDMSKFKNVFAKALNRQNGSISWSAVVILI